jgi:hypothetical protein
MLLLLLLLVTLTTTAKKMTVKKSFSLIISVKSRILNIFIFLLETMEGLATSFLIPDVIRLICQSSPTVVKKLSFFVCKIRQRCWRVSKQTNNTNLWTRFRILKTHLGEQGDEEVNWAELTDDGSSDGTFVDTGINPGVS